MVGSQHPPFLFQLYNNTCGSGLSPLTLGQVLRPMSQERECGILLIVLTSNWFRNPGLGRSAQSFSQMAGKDLFRINSSM